MSPNDKLFLVTIYVIGGGALIAATWLGLVEWRRRRRSAWRKRFADLRFSPGPEETRKRYSKYDEPTCLRTPREDQELSPLLRRQA
jgi:hypothetical protein